MLKSLRTKGVKLLHYFITKIRLLNNKNLNILLAAIISLIKMNLWNICYYCVRVRLEESDKKKFDLNRSATRKWSCSAERWKIEK